MGLKYAIDDLGRAVTRQKLITYAAAILAVACVRALFLFLMRRIIIGASRDIEYDLRNEFFAQAAADAAGVLPGAGAPAT